MQALYRLGWFFFSRFVLPFIFDSVIATNSHFAYNEIECVICIQTGEPVRIYKNQKETRGTEEHTHVFTENKNFLWRGSQQKIVEQRVSLYKQYPILVSIHRTRAISPKGYHLTIGILNCSSFAFLQTHGRSHFVSLSARFGAIPATEPHVAHLPIPTTKCFIDHLSSECC